MAELGRAALTGATVPELIARAVDTVAEGLNAVRVGLFERRADNLVAIAAQGWSMGEKLALDADSPIARAFREGDSAITETMAVAPVRGEGDGLTGVFAVVSAEPVVPDDVVFLRSVANLVAAAIVRDRAESRLEFLAEAGRLLGRADFLQAARELAEFLLGPLSDDDGRLHRSWRGGRRSNPGYLEDYADVANGLYELHVATGELRWLLEANRLVRLAVELFADEEGGGFFLSPTDGEQLVARKKEFDDHPTPSGNSMLAFALLRLARIWGDDELERQAAGVFRLIRDALPRAPSAFGHALCALDLYLAPPRELAVIGSPEDAIAQAALASFDPNAVVAFGPSEDVPLLVGKDFVDGHPALYVCERFACRAPVTEPSQLAGVS